MSTGLFSSSWHRVAGLRPRLQDHATIQRRKRRGEFWYMVEDRGQGRFYRLPVSAHAVVSLMDGTRTAEEIWRAAAKTLGDKAPTQDELIQLLSQLHKADLLACDAFPDLEELAKRRDRRRRDEAAGILCSPFFWRIPLIDPDRWLGRIQGITRPFFSRAAFALWLSVSGTALALAILHWEELTSGVQDRILAPGNLLILWPVLLAAKAAHELAHALAVKTFGGCVREMGIAILVFSPVPYVDASAATGLREKRHRILVSAAGMMVESFLGSLALFAWLVVEPGAVRALLYDVIFATGVSTFLFNGNPLVRFDGYYILCDALDRPNLFATSRRCLAHAIERHFLGNRELADFPGSRSERAFLFAYGIASLIYRLALLGAILVLIAGRFFALGAILAVWGVLAWGLRPAVRGIIFVLSSPRLRRGRARALAASTGACLVVLAALFWVPLPSMTVAEGVIRLSESAIVRPGADVFIRRIVPAPDRPVVRGEPLFVGEDPELEARVHLLEAEVEELRARKDGFLPDNPLRAQVVVEELGRRERILLLEMEKLGELTVRSPDSGLFVVPRPEDLAGRFVARGEPLAYVVSRGSASARVAIAQEDADRVRSTVRRTTIRWLDGRSDPMPAGAMREVPAASSRLPSPALGTLGGGAIPADPRDADGTTSIKGTFQLDLELPDFGGPIPIGGRVLVRFEHEPEPIAQRIYRMLRRLFLSRFES